MDYGFELIAAKPTKDQPEPATAQPMRVGDKIRRSPSTDQKSTRRQLQRGVNKKADIDKEAWGNSPFGKNWGTECMWSSWPGCTKTADVMITVPTNGSDALPACNTCAKRLASQGAVVVGPAKSMIASINWAKTAGRSTWLSDDDQVIAQFVVQGNKLDVDVSFPMGFESHAFSLKSIEAAIQWVSSFDTEVVRSEPQVAEGILTAARAAVVSGRTAALKLASGLGFPDMDMPGNSTWADGYGNWHAIVEGTDGSVAQKMIRQELVDRSAVGPGYRVRVVKVEDLPNGRSHWTEASKKSAQADVTRFDDGHSEWKCEQCGGLVERFRGEGDVTCDRCGAEYNASGQRLRDDWRGNESNYDDDIGDMEGYERQYSHDGSLKMAVEGPKGFWCRACGQYQSIRNTKQIRAMEAHQKAHEDAGEMPLDGHPWRKASKTAVDDGALSWSSIPDPFNGTAGVTHAWSADVGDGNLAEWYEHDDGSYSWAVFNGTLVADGGEASSASEAQRAAEAGAAALGGGSAQTPAGGAPALASRKTAMDEAGNPHAMSADEVNKFMNTSPWPDGRWLPADSTFGPDDNFYQRDPQGNDRPGYFWVAYSEKTGRKTSALNWRHADWSDQDYWYLVPADIPGGRYFVNVRAYGPDQTPGYHAVIMNADGGEYDADTLAAEDSFGDLAGAKAYVERYFARTGSKVAYLSPDWLKQNDHLWMLNGNDGDYAFVGDAVTAPAGYGGRDWLEIRNSAGSLIERQGDFETLIHAQAMAEYLLARRVTGSRKVAWTIDQVKAVTTSGSYATVDGMMLDQFSASALSQIFDALSSENQAKIAALPLEKAVAIAFQLANGKSGSKTADAGALFDIMDEQMESLKNAKSNADVFRVCGKPGEANKGFWGGDGAELWGALHNAGWSDIDYRNDYEWAMQAPNGDQLTNVEGDLYAGMQLMGSRRTASDFEGAELIAWARTCANAAGTASVSRFSGTDLNKLCDMAESNGKTGSQIIGLARRYAKVVGGSISGTELLKLCDLAEKTASPDDWWPLVPSTKYPGERDLICPVCSSPDVVITGSNLGSDVVRGTEYTLLICNSCGNRQMFPK